MGGNEVLQHAQTFAKVGSDGGFDNFAGRFCHQAPHSGELPNLLRTPPGSRISHHEDGIEARDGNFLTLFVGDGLGGQITQHFIRDSIRDFRPDVHDLVITFPVRNETVFVLLLNLSHTRICPIEQLLLICGDFHILEGDGNPRLRGIFVSNVLQFIRKDDRSFTPCQPVAQVNEIP